MRKRLRKRIEGISVSGFGLFAWMICLGTEALPEFDLAPLEVTGSRMGGDSFNTPAGILSVDTASSDAVPGSLYDLLKRVPGIMIESPGGLAGNAVLYLRGAEPNFSKILIDGIEVNNLNDTRGGGYNFRAIAEEAVLGIDVLPGSQSAIYGSDALGGVLQVTTIPDQIEAGATAGNVYLGVADGGYTSAGFDMSHAERNVLYKFHVNRVEEDGLLPGYSFEAWRGHFGVLAEPAPGLTVKVSGLASDVQRSYFPDDSGGPVYAVFRESEQAFSDERGAALQARYGINESSQLYLSLQAYQADTTIDSPGVAPGPRDPFGIPPNRFASEFERTGATTYLRQSVYDRFQLVVGGSFRREAGTSDSLVRYPFGEVRGRYNLKTDTRSGFFEFGGLITGTQFLGAGFRIDSISGSESVTTKGLRYRAGFLDGKLAFEATYGEGFKQPSFFARGNPVVGNPGLYPEESESAEASLVIELPAINGSSWVSVFRQRFTNLIDLSEGPPPQLVNLGGVESRGLTWEIRSSPVEQFEIRAHLSQLDLKVPDGELLRNRPEWQAGAALEWLAAEPLSFTGSWRYVGSRFDSSIPTGTRKLGGYTVVDLAFTWRLSPQLNIHLQIENLLDHAYSEVIGVNDPGRRFRVRVRWRF